MVYQCENIQQCVREISFVDNHQTEFCGYNMRKT